MRELKSALEQIELLERLDLLNSLANCLEFSWARLWTMFYAMVPFEGALRQNKAISATSI